MWHSEEDIQEVNNITSYVETTSSFGMRGRMLKVCTSWVNWLHLDSRGRSLSLPIFFRTALRRPTYRSKRNGQYLKLLRIIVRFFKKLNNSQLLMLFLASVGDPDSTFYINM
jgi:hypothetical protein